MSRNLSLWKSHVARVPAAWGLGEGEAGWEEGDSRVELAPARTAI